MARVAKAKQVYLSVYVIFHSGQVFDFAHLDQQSRCVDQLILAMQSQHSNLCWDNAIQQYQMREYIDFNSPPKMTCLMTADCDELLNDNPIIMTLDAQPLTLPISQSRLYLYPFNMGLLEFKVAVPEQYWQDPKRLKAIIADINDSFIHPKAIEDRSWLQPYHRLLLTVQEVLTMAVRQVEVPLLKTPFVHLNLFLQRQHIIQGSHVALCAIYPEGFDVNSMHLQAAMLDNAPSGVTNLAQSQTDFAFTESHDSLFVICSDDDLDMAEQTLNEKWLSWLRFHEFSWKMQWELDLVLSSILNATAVRLKSAMIKLEKLDVYRINGFINYMWLCLDSHHPRNLANYTTGTQTLFIDTSNYLNAARANWNTQVLMTEGMNKMAMLEKLIHQMNDYGHRTDPTCARSQKSLMIATMSAMLAALAYVSYYWFW